MVKRLTIADWENIMRNVAESSEEVEVVWLDNGGTDDGEYGLHCEDELFEDGFKTESDAMDRLAEIELVLSTGRGWQVLGYFTDKDEEEELDQYNVMVVIEDTGLPAGKLQCYTPGEQHDEIDWHYLDWKCEPISKAEYKEAGKLFYTPKEYL